jgi:hypothetical protein
MNKVYTFTDIVLNDFTKISLKEGYEMFKDKFIDYEVTEHIDVGTLQEQSNIIQEVVDFRVSKGIGSLRGGSCAEHPDNLIFILLMTNNGWELDDINDLMKNKYVLEQNIDYGAMVKCDDMTNEDISGVLCSCSHHTFKHINIVKTISNCRILIGSECIKKNTILSNLNKDLYNIKHKTKQYCSYDGCKNFVSVSKWKKSLRHENKEFISLCKYACDEHYKDMYMNAKQEYELKYPTPIKIITPINTIVSEITPTHTHHLKDCEYCGTKFQSKDEWKKTCLVCYREHSRSCSGCSLMFLPAYKNRKFATKCFKCYKQMKGF